MKLTKAILIKLIKPGMESLGYHWFKDSISGAQGLFAKKVDDTLYLTVGMTIHRFYDDAFTADLYLSKTTSIYCTWNDIPKDCIKRLGEMIPTNNGSVKNHDSWWSCEEPLADCFDAIKQLELGMCNDKSLIERIYQSKEVVDMSIISSKIKKNIENVPDIEYLHVPTKEIDNIPIYWFKATEFTLREMGRDIDSRTVKFHASDAYRQYILD